MQKILQFKMLFVTLHSQLGNHPFAFNFGLMSEWLGTGLQNR